ncbi:MAG: ABC transporter permease [Planctomycetota bacterium]
MLGKMKNLIWLAVAVLSTTAAMVWKSRQSDQVTMEVYVWMYKALGIGVGALALGLVVLNFRRFCTSSNRVGVIGWKEFTAYFRSWIGYIILIDFLIIVGARFYNIVTDSEQGVSTAYLEYIGPMMGWWMYFISMLTVPMITMRLFAEEKSSGTIEMLVTAPVSEVQIVLGKYLAALAFYFLTLLPTVILVFLVRAYAPEAPKESPQWFEVFKWIGHLFRSQNHPELGTIFTSYLGVFLFGAVFLSIGTLISSLTKHQVICGMLTLHLLLVLWLVLYFVTKEPWEGVAKDTWQDKTYIGLKYIQFDTHLAPFLSGVVDSRGIVYALGAVVFFLFLTVKSLEVRRWA